MKNNAIRNSIQNGGRYHIRIFDMAGKEVKHIPPTWWNTYVYAWAKLKIGHSDNQGGRTEIDYSSIMRIEIHAAQFPYKEEIPWLYIYLK